MKRKMNDTKRVYVNGALYSNSVVLLAGAIFRLRSAEFVFSYTDFSYIYVPVNFSEQIIIIIRKLEPR
jgi:hypothetical protein